MDIVRRGHRVGLPVFELPEAKGGCTSSTRESREDPDLDTWLAPLIGSDGIISPSECREGEQKRRHLGGTAGVDTRWAYDTSQVWLHTVQCCTVVCMDMLVNYGYSVLYNWHHLHDDLHDTTVQCIHRYIHAVHTMLLYPFDLSLLSGLAHHSCSWIAKERLNQGPIDRLAFNCVAGQPKDRQYNHGQKENHPKCRPVLCLGVSAFHAFQFRRKIGCHQADWEEQYGGLS